MELEKFIQKCDTGEFDLVKNMFDYNHISDAFHFIIKYKRYDLSLNLNDIAATDTLKQYSIEDPKYINFIKKNITDYRYANFCAFWHIDNDYNCVSLDVINTAIQRENYDCLYKIPNYQNILKDTKSNCNYDILFLIINKGLWNPYEEYYQTGLLLEIGELSNVLYQFILNQDYQIDLYYYYERYWKIEDKKIISTQEINFSRILVEIENQLYFINLCLNDYICNDCANLVLGYMGF